MSKICWLDVAAICADAGHQIDEGASGALGVAWSRGAVSFKAEVLRLKRDGRLSYEGAKFLLDILILASWYDQLPGDTCHARQAGGTQ